MSGEPTCGFQDKPPRGEVREQVRNVWIGLGIILVIAAAIIVSDGVRGAEFAAWIGELNKFLFPPGASPRQVLSGAELLMYQLWILGLILIVWATVSSILVIQAFHRARCAEQEGEDSCWAGAINQISQGFDRKRDWIFPYAAHHPYIDVVVKQIDWPSATDGAYWIHCAQDSTPPSFLIRTYFRDSALCAAGATLSNVWVASAMGLVGGIVGVAAGVAAALAVAGAVGCATVLLCPLALLAFVLAGVVAAIAAVVLIAAVVANAVRGTVRGHDAATGSGRGSQPGDPSAAPLRIGDLVTVEGRLVTHFDLDGANVGWFGNRDSLMVHGRIDASPPYNHILVEEFLPENTCSTT